MIDEHLELNDMVEEKALAGKRELGAWFRRCRLEVGDIGVGTFRKLMSSLVKSTMQAPRFGGAIKTWMGLSRLS